MTALLDLRSHARALAPSLPDLPHLRESAIATWRGRMINEHGSAIVFDGLAHQLASAGLADAADSCRGFADEERLHGVLCGAVVEGLGGEARAPALDDRMFPTHLDALPIEGALRNVLSVGCLSETVAVALIGAERLAMPEGPLRELLTRIYADEVGHARFGWTLMNELVPQLEFATRARLSTYLRVAFGHLERHEIAHLQGAEQPPEGAALGLCAGREAQELFYATIDSVIVPKLDALGLGATEAWATRRF